MLEIVLHGSRFQNYLGVHALSPPPRDLCCQPPKYLVSSDGLVLYSKHLHSCEVASMNNIVTINYDELLDYHPFDIYLVKIGEITRKYIRMRYDLADCKN